VNPPPEAVVLPTSRAEAELGERGSRFLGAALPCDTVEEALALRDAERRRYHDATHHVFAVRLAGGDVRYDDDGEPSGTGGRPVLDAIIARDFVDTAVIVTRYYGGTKLGTGGLARAYGGAAAMALDACRSRRVRPGEVRHVRYDYADTGTVARLLDAPGIQRGTDEFGDGVRTEIRLAQGRGPAFARRLRDATAGRAELEADVSPARCWIPVT
jgi:uncharacterized YigZ family protein